MKIVIMAEVYPLNYITFHYDEELVKNYVQSNWDKVTNYFGYNTDLFFQILSVLLFLLILKIIHIFYKRNKS